jgi:hypothetical protein
MFDKLVEVLRSEIFKNLLRVIGAYGIIVVFAQDIGVRTGCKQALFTQNIWIQIIVFTSVAFSVSDDLAQSFTGTMLYLFLKYKLSKGVTNDVCFPTECEIRQCESKKAPEKPKKTVRFADSSSTHSELPTQISTL